MASEAADNQTVATSSGPAVSGPVIHHGRAISWVAISLVILGFLIGAIGMIIGQHGPNWGVFWTGTGVAVAGMLLTVATNTFADWY